MKAYTPSSLLRSTAVTIIARKTKIRFFTRPITAHSTDCAILRSLSVERTLASFSIKQPSPPSPSSLLFLSETQQPKVGHVRRYQF